MIQEVDNRISSVTAKTVEHEIDKKVEDVDPKKVRRQKEETALIGHDEFAAIADTDQTAQV